MASDQVHELELLVSRLVDQRLSPAEAARLNALLLESPEARARYQELLDNHEALCAIYPGGVYSSSLDSELAEVKLAAAPQQTARSPRSAWLQWAGVAAAIVIAIGAFIKRSDVAPRAESSGARLVAAVDVDWQGNSRTEAPNTSLLPGAALSLGDFALAEGTIELEFGDGARVSIQGPAKFELRNGGHIHLESGNLVARIPEEALGFVVTTPEAEVVDLGTEFGLSVGEDGRTDIHVLDGLVEVLPVRGDGEEGIQISEGDARRLDHQGVNGIEPATREALLEPHRLDRYGLELLRGAVRVTEGLDVEAQTSGQHWIDIVPEGRGVLVETSIEATIDSPGVYRRFRTPLGLLPAGTRVDSYLLHFRPTAAEPVRGVIKFAAPIVAMMGRVDQLEATDRRFGLGSLDYPDETWRFRGLESLGSRTPGENGYPVSDEVTLSQDRRTISLKMRANIDVEEGIDQVRVLTLSEEGEK